MDELAHYVDMPFPGSETPLREGSQRIGRLFLGSPL